jgi:hypothetical protein
MGQRKSDSLLESVFNSIISVVMYAAVLGVVSLITDDILVALWSTFIVSIGKNYVVRRIGVRREQV